MAPVRTSATPSARRVASSSGSSGDALGVGGRDSEAFGPRRSARRVLPKNPGSASVATAGGASTGPSGGICSSSR